MTEGKNKRGDDYGNDDKCGNSDGCDTSEHCRLCIHALEGSAFSGSLGVALYS